MYVPNAWKPARDLRNSRFKRSVFTLMLTQVYIFRKFFWSSYCWVKLWHQFSILTWLVNILSSTNVIDNIRTIVPAGDRDQCRGPMIEILFFLNPYVVSRRAVPTVIQLTRDKMRPNQSHTFCLAFKNVNLYLIPMLDC